MRDILFNDDGPVEKRACLRMSSALSKYMKITLERGGEANGIRSDDNNEKASNDGKRIVQK